MGYEMLPFSALELANYVCAFLISCEAASCHQFPFAWTCSPDYLYDACVFYELGAARHSYLRYSTVAVLCRFVVAGRSSSRAFEVSLGTPGTVRTCLRLH